MQLITRPRLRFRTRVTVTKGALAPWATDRCATSKLKSAFRDHATLRARDANPRHGFGRLTRGFVATIRCGRGLDGSVQCLARCVHAACPKSQCARWTGKAPAARRPL